MKTATKFDGKKTHTHTRKRTVLFLTHIHEQKHWPVFFAGAPQIKMTRKKMNRNCILFHKSLAITAIKWLGDRPVFSVASTDQP